MGDTLSYSALNRCDLDQIAAQINMARLQIWRGFVEATRSRTPTLIPHRIGLRVDGPRDTLAAFQTAGSKLACALGCRFLAWRTGIHGPYELMSLMDENRTTTPGTQNVAYLLLLATQIAAAIVFVWQELPEFDHLLNHPGEQLSKSIHSDLVTIGVFCVMQISFWYRLLHVPMPSLRPNPFLNHVFLFLGKLSFVFGGALFAVVVFRHLPNLGQDADLLQATERGMIFVGCLFALFCTSLEVERLGQAFERKRD